MRILIASHVFLPRLGGIEVMTDCLARGFQAAGHEVEVATMTGGRTEAPLPYRVLRRPSLPALFAAARRSEAVLLNGFGLRFLLPVLLARRPVAVVHQTWLPDEPARAPKAVLRRWALRRCRNIAISGAIGEHLPSASEIVPNCYRDGLFRDLGQGGRDTELCCVARMVSDKGVDLLIAALGRLAVAGQKPGLLLIGDGPERPALEKQIAGVRLGAQVRFAGMLAGGALVEALNGCRVLVVPSRFREPFGIVALEGAASGCVVIGADGGGLGEAIGPCGTTFTRGSAESLAEQLRAALGGELAARDPKAVAAHLARHSEAAVVARYLAILQSMKETAA